MAQGEQSTYPITLPASSSLYLMLSPKREAYRYTADQGPFASLSRSQTMGEPGIGLSQPLHISQSFSRLESTRPTLLGRNRASTLQHGVITEQSRPDITAFSLGENGKTQPKDIFDKNSSDSSLTTSSTGAADAKSSQRIAEGSDELPIELISLTDRYESPLWFINIC